jgi:hypothetical protein
MFKILKRWLPAICAGLLAFGYYHYTAQQQVHQAALAHAVQVGSLDADSPLIARAANTAVPPFGDVTGKLIYAVGLFLTGIAVTWFVLRFVVPVVPRWATGHGTKAGGLPGQPGFAEGFAEKSASDKVDTTLRVLVALWVLWGICALAACLVK